MCRDGAKSKYKVRCGPQAELPYSPGSGNPTAPAPVININRSGASLNAPVGTVVKEGEVASNVRVVPRHVYENRRLVLTTTTVPKGYRKVFDDGRLNPYRAEQTFAGKAAMDAIWTQEVPRELRRDLQDGSSAVVSSKSTTAPATSSTAVISTKSVAKEKSIRLSGQSYVQVATYQDKNAAQGAAKRIQSMGLPAKIGKYERNGATYRIVLAGPFATSDKADRAASKARGAGYSGAFVRN
ncbi:Sporulation related domain-containing protein [Shimia gijangensis]|uniref:Sporulation related domain-containing protein n=1 Tax=Shimia gijangensis TaxID=1470563 RepID=A0A1M6PH60_9RHOB|nr:Sporulation related domain-containing protein [Shimia gijangensis]